MHVDGDVVSGMAAACQPVVLVCALCCGGRTDHDQQHCYHHAPTVKPEAVTAVVVAPDDGREDARKHVELYLNDK
jgi:hypothetical protein